MCRTPCIEHRSVNRRDACTERRGVDAPSTEVSSAEDTCNKRRALKRRASRCVHREPSTERQGTERRSTESRCMHRAPSAEALSTKRRSATPKRQDTDTEKRRSTMRRSACTERQDAMH
ncbi:UNVERIFIED_CONTAM: hypothetical protein FKN15_015411 [Acipenser sinensis]